jgi:hypothetical protein
MDQRRQSAYIPTNSVYQQHSVLRTSLPVVPIPATPAPKTINEIQTDARERFAGIVWIQKDSSRPVEDYFVDYDNWELYSENKSYSKRPYQAAYKGVMREYHNYLCILNGDDGEEFYVVAKRIRSELEQLEPYCTCITCSACVMNPIKYLWCPNCTKCIKAGSGFAKPEYITKAKQLKEATEKYKSNPSKYGKYIQGTRWIKAAELVTAGLIFVVALWLRS